MARPTRDIDFLGRIENSPEAVAAMVRECLAVESAGGVEFSADVSVEPITIEDRYPGERALVETRLAGARMRLQLDIGVADIAVPGPAWVDYPALLDMDAPHILAYQPATAIAEKFETMISKGLLNSRVKDYYDIWMLSRSVFFAGGDLTESIAATFERRGTAVPSSRPAVLSDDYAKRPERMTQWAAFVTRLGGSGIEAPDRLVDVVDDINVFIMPPANAAAAGQPFSLNWAPGNGWS
ncbi:MAG: nucleotidyl transferase AbiEii/AbiGii toxin family protein [Coriobacteriia bacterium]